MREYYGRHFDNSATVPQLVEAYALDTEEIQEMKAALQELSDLLE